MGAHTILTDITYKAKTAPSLRHPTDHLHISEMVLPLHNTRSTLSTGTELIEQKINTEDVIVCDYIVVHFTDNGKALRLR